MDISRPVLSLLVLLPLSCLVSLRADVVFLSNGEALRGELLGMQASFVLLDVGGGERAAVRRIAPEEIAHLEFEDAHLPLEAQATRRSSLLGLLSKPDESLLLDLLEGYLLEDRHLEALSYAKLWSGKMSHSGHQTRLFPILIQAAIGAGLKDEAAVHARRWIESAPVSSVQPIAWQVLAEAAREQKDHESALWLSLQPVAARQGPITEQLRACYTLAVDSYSSLGYDEHANLLRAELDATSQQTPPLPLLNLPSIHQPDTSFESILKTRIQP